MCPLHHWEVVSAASYNPYQGNVSSEIALTDLAMVLVSWEEAHRQNVADGGSVHDIFQTPCQGVCWVLCIRVPSGRVQGGWQALLYSGFQFS